MHEVIYMSTYAGLENPKWRHEILARLIESIHIQKDKIDRQMHAVIVNASSIWNN